MSDLGRIKLVLFFTLGMSIKGWYDAGLVSRDSLLYERLCDQGYEVFFITYGDGDEQQYLPASSHIQVLTKPVGLTARQYGWRIPSIHWNVLRNVDIIKSHQILGSRFAVLASLRLRKRYVARCGYLRTVFTSLETRSWRRRLVAWLEECLAFRLADAVCVPSRAEIEHICKRYGLNPTKVHACPNWIETELFKPNPAVAKHPRRVCFIGRFHPQKQPLLLLEAVKGIKNIELLMIGGGHLKKQIEAKIQEYGLRATILNRVPNEMLPDYLNSSAVYVLPTLYEGGSPKTLLEAMACGLPVVSTNAVGVNEAFQDAVHGYKCWPDDVHGIREAIMAVLGDPIRSKRFGEQGRQHVVRNFSIDAALERELCVLGALTAKGTGVVS